MATPSIALAQEGGDQEDWDYLEGQVTDVSEWAGDEPYVVLPAFASARDLPGGSNQQCTDFTRHLLEDHPERYDLAMKLLTGLRNKSIVPDQVGMTNGRAVAFFTLREFGKVALIWGPSVIPTIFNDVTPDYVRGQLNGLRRVHPTGKKTLHALSMLAGCLLQGVPQEQPETAPAKNPTPAPNPKPINPIVIGLIIFLFLGFVLLLGGGTQVAPV